MTPDGAEVSGPETEVTGWAAALLVELSESPLPGARYAYGVVQRRLPRILEQAAVEARAAAVAPLERALRACIAGFDEWDAERGRAPLPGIPERWWQASEAARRLLSAPSPVREPEQ